MLQRKSVVSLAADDVGPRRGGDPRPSPHERSDASAFAGMVSGLQRRLEVELHEERLQWSRERSEWAEERRELTSALEQQREMDAALQQRLGDAFADFNVTLRQLNGTVVQQSADLEQEESRLEDAARRQRLELGDGLRQLSQQASVLPAPPSTTLYQRHVNKSLELYEGCRAWRRGAELAGSSVDVDPEKFTLVCPKGYTRFGKLGSAFANWGMSPKNNSAADIGECAKQCDDNTECGLFAYTENYRNYGLNGCSLRARDKMSEKDQYFYVEDMVSCSKDAVKAPDVSTTTAFPAELDHPGPIHLHTKCSAAHDLLLRPTTAGLSRTCCPTGDIRCAGCAAWEPLEGSTDGKCTTCHGGYVMQRGSCIACVDTAGWLDRHGRTCQQLSELQGMCSNVTVHGVSSSQACCFCGGGHPSATPFVYDPVLHAIGESVDARPKPRTAKLYSVDQKCMFAKFGLSMDGSTGRVFGTPSSPEPLDLECEITSHQPDGLTFTANLKISIQQMVYDSAVLTFSPEGDTGKREPRLDPSSEFKDFSVDCVPEVRWLKIDAATGVITKTDAPGVGAVTSVDDKFDGQAGGVCIVSASSLERKSKGTPEPKPVSTAVVIIKLNPWPSLAYKTSSIAATIGQIAPRVEPRGFKDASLLKPSSYSMACDVEGLDPRHSPEFAFDPHLGAGFVAGHPVLDVSADGGVVVSPARSLAALFDSDIFAVQTQGARKKLELSCRVFGHFPVSTVTPVSVLLNIVIWDNVCFLPESFLGSSHDIDGHENLTSCRLACRASSSCSHFSFDKGHCRQFSRDTTYPAADTTGKTVEAWSKVTNCSDETSCVGVPANDYVAVYLAGRYCPHGVDMLRGTVYKRDGLTPEETAYLVKYSKDLDGPIDTLIDIDAAKGCGNLQDGHYLLRQVDDKVDKINQELGNYELFGQLRACIPVADFVSGVFNGRLASSESPTFATLSPAVCAAPPFPVPEVGEDGLPIDPLVLDNPSTREDADFWLHPCSCVPPEWGVNPPVSPQSSEAIPPGSNNRFIPQPFLISSGMLVCDMEFLISVFFEGADSVVDDAACLALCKEATDCGYYWIGSQHDTMTCRLYSGCNFLVREYGMAGQLMAVPDEEMCQIADPDACWTSSLRREFLGAALRHTAGFHYLNLFQQCDFVLLLGGYGVEKCSRPNFRRPDSHEWAHKRMMPAVFEHGQVLGISCWSDRFVGAKLDGSVQRSMQVRCVNGKWYDTNTDTLGVAHFKCSGCAQVSAPGYSQYLDLKKQELVWVNDMKTIAFSSTKTLDSSQCMLRSSKRFVVSQTPALEACPSGTTYLIADVHSNGSRRTLQPTVQDCRDECVARADGCPAFEYSSSSGVCWTHAAGAVAVGTQEYGWASCVITPQDCPEGSKYTPNNIHSDGGKLTTNISNISTCRDECKGRAGLCPAFEYYPSNQSCWTHQMGAKTAGKQVLGWMTCNMEPDIFQCGIKFDIDFCSYWCNTKGRWGCEASTLKASDSRNTDGVDYTCSCKGCNGCPSSTPDCPAGTRHTSQKIVGSDAVRTTEETIEACSAKCEDESDCAAFEYHPTTGSCWQKIVGDVEGPPTPAPTTAPTLVSAPTPPPAPVVQHFKGDFKKKGNLHKDSNSDCSERSVLDRLRSKFKDKYKDRYWWMGCAQLRAGYSLECEWTEWTKPAAKAPPPKPKKRKAALIVEAGRTRRRRKRKSKGATTTTTTKATKEQKEEDHGWKIGSDEQVIAGMESKPLTYDEEAEVRDRKYRFKLCSIKSTYEGMGGQGLTFKETGWTDWSDFEDQFSVNQGPGGFYSRMESQYDGRTKDRKFRMMTVTVEDDIPEIDTTKEKDLIYVHVPPNGGCGVRGNKFHERCQCSGETTVDFCKFMCDSDKYCKGYVQSKKGCEYYTKKDCALGCLKLDEGNHGKITTQPGGDSYKGCFMRSKPYKFIHANRDCTPSSDWLGKQNAESCMKTTQGQGCKYFAHMTQPEENCKCCYIGFNVTEIEANTSIDIFESVKGTNNYVFDKKVGQFSGGMCTCPDGQEYAVGDNKDSCGSLACVGGMPGTCHSGITEGKGMKVICANAAGSATCEADFKGCTELVFRHTSKAPEASRLVSLASDRDVCVEERWGSLRAESCNASITKQLIPAQQIPSMLKDMTDKKAAVKVDFIVDREVEGKEGAVSLVRVGVDLAGSSHNSQSCPEDCDEDGEVVCRLCTDEDGACIPCLSTIMWDKCIKYYDFLRTSCKEYDTLKAYKSDCRTCERDMIALFGETKCAKNSALDRVSFGAGQGARCNAVPVITIDSNWTLNKYGKPPEKTDVNARWRHQLAAVNVECGSGRVLHALKVDGMGIHHKCAAVAGIGACVMAYSDQLDSDLPNIDVLDNLPLVCPKKEILGGFHFEHSESGKWVRWKMFCCGAGSLPTVLRPLGRDRTQALPFDGTYCPIGKDMSGRLRYQQVPHCEMAALPGNGWCPEGYYRGWDGMHLTLESCKSACLADPACQAIGFCDPRSCNNSEGVRGSCSRYSRACESSSLECCSQHNQNETVTFVKNCQVENPSESTLCTADLSSRRRSGESCAFFLDNGYCAVAVSARRRNWGGEAANTCETTCADSLKCRLATPEELADMPDPTPAPTSGLCGPDDSIRRRTKKTTCGFFHRKGFCNFTASARRRAWGGEASDTCRTTCHEVIGCDLPGMPPKAPSDSADGSESKLLEYDPVHGEWCLWKDICVTSHLVEPVGLKSDEFEIVHITNFNGEFVGGGMPEYGGGLAPGELPPDFKRAEKPEPPAAPELLEENYSTEEFAPEYAQECKFDELFTYPKPFAWDTIKDKYGEEEIKYTYQHETDDDGKSTAAEMGLPPEHPCRVAAETGGLFDAKFSGDKDGDGETHDELGYDALFGCTPRKRKRTKTVEEVEAASDEYEEHAGKILKAVKSACSIAPATGIEPFGFGITIEIPKICSSIAEVTKAIADWIHSAVARKQMTDIATASQSDCDTTQAGLARLVCDVHCVRDAVLRGDLNLRRIMSKATHLTNQNLKNFAEWGVDSMNSRTDWLAAKIDDLEVILGTKIDGVAAKVLVQKASRDIGVMLQEMQTYAQQAETDTATRVIARRALSKFVASAEGEHASAPGNMSQVISVLKEVTSLHAVLKVSGQTSRRDAARVMLTEGVQHMQRIAKESLATIGIYKHHSMSTKRQVREWTATRAAGALILIELDKVWWHIRNQMDDFIEVAEGHVWSFTHAFDALAGYRECTSGFSQLLSAYNGAMAAREASHQKLHETWRATSSMFEELASMIVDADVFTNFMTQEGCDSSLASQTLHQAMLSVGAMGLLMDRYDAGGLPSPDVEPVRVALARIRNSFNASQRACNEM